MANAEIINKQVASVENAVLHGQQINIFRQKPYQVVNLHHTEWYPLDPSTPAPAKLDHYQTRPLEFLIGPNSDIIKYQQIVAAIRGVNNDGLDTPIDLTQAISTAPPGQQGHTNNPGVAFVNGLAFVWLENSETRYVSKVLSQERLRAEYHWWRYFCLLDKDTAVTLQSDYLYFTKGQHNAHARALAEGHRLTYDWDVGHQRLNRETLLLLSGLGQNLRQRMHLPAGINCLVANCQGGDVTAVRVALDSIQLRVHVVHLMRAHRRQEWNRINTARGLFDLIHRVDVQEGIIPANTGSIKIDLTNLRDTYHYLLCFFWPTIFDRQSTIADKGYPPLGFNGLRMNNDPVPVVDQNIMVRWNTNLLYAPGHHPAKVHHEIEQWAFPLNPGVGIYRFPDIGELSPEEVMHSVVTFNQLPPGWTADYAISTVGGDTRIDVQTYNAAGVLTNLPAGPWGLGHTYVQMMLDVRDAASIIDGGVRILEAVPGACNTEGTLVSASNFDYFLWQSSVQNCRKYHDTPYGLPDQRIPVNFPWELTLADANGKQLMPATRTSDLCTRTHAEYFFKQGGVMTKSPLPDNEAFPVPVISFGEMPCANQNAITGVKDFAAFSRVVLFVNFNSSGDQVPGLRDFRQTSGDFSWNYLIMGVGPDWVNRARGKMTKMKQ